MGTEKVPNIITAAMKAYRKERLPNPEEYEAGLRDGLIIAVIFLQTCAGIPSELEIEVEGMED